MQETNLVGVDPLIHCKKCGWRGNQSDTLLIRAVGEEASLQEQSQAFVNQMALAVGNAVYRPLKRLLTAIFFPVNASDEEKEKAAKIIELLTSSGISGAFTGVMKAMQDIEESGCQKTKS